jgi:hypothetical protein
MMRGRSAALGVSLAAVLALSAAVQAVGDAKGSLTYISRGKPLTLALTHAYLIVGPDAVDPQVTIRRLLFTGADVEAKLKACTTMFCVSAAMGDGLEFDLVDGPRYNYWLSLNGQLVQYSGTAKRDALVASTNTPTRVAGKLVLDGTAGGPTVDVTFDAALVKTFTKAR